MQKNNSVKSNKMVFVAVTISLVMIFIACIVSYPQVIPDETGDIAEVTEDTTISSQTTVTFKSEQPVNNAVSNVPKDTSKVVTDTSKTTTSSTKNSTIGTSTIDYSNRVIMPVANAEVLCEFSNGELVKSSTSGIWQTHNGVDFKADVNTPVQAVTDGTVKEVYEDALLGICVVIEHDGFTAKYCNLDKGVIVSAEETVIKGQVIGTVGNTSVSESALDNHIHFEVLKANKYVNPLDVISK